MRWPVSSRRSRVKCSYARVLSVSVILSATASSAPVALRAIRVSMVRPQSAVPQPEGTKPSSPTSPGVEDAGDAGVDGLLADREEREGHGVAEEGRDDQVPPDAP